jgi:hypothetical protein
MRALSNSLDEVGIQNTNRESKRKKVTGKLKKIKKNLKKEMIIG